MHRSRALLVIGLVLVPTLAFAQSDDDKGTARALGHEGQDALDRKDYVVAADRFGRAVAIFDEAKALVPPTLLLNLARANVGLGHFVSAQEDYNRVVRQGTTPGAPAVFVQAVEEAKKEIDAVAPHLAAVTISVTGCSDPRVTIDDKPMSAAAIGVKKPVDPGTHVVKATAQGCKGGQASFTVAEAGAAVAAITLEHDPMAAPPVDTVAAPVATPVAPAADQPASSFPSKTLAITSFAVGAAGLAFGAVTGVVALGKKSTLKNECKNPDGTCMPSAQADLDSYHTMGALSTVGFIVGGIGAAAGLVFLISAPKSSASSSSAWIAPVIGPASIGAIGRF
jgi:hypothetical protein